MKLRETLRSKIPATVENGAGMKGTKQKTLLKPSRSGSICGMVVFLVEALSSGWTKK